MILTSSWLQAKMFSLQLAGGLKNVWFQSNAWRKKKDVPVLYLKNQNYLPTKEIIKARCGRFVYYSPTEGLQDRQMYEASMSCISKPK